MKKIILYLLAVFLFSCETAQDYLNQPQKGDIYLFESDGYYFPVMADIVLGDTVSCVNSKFVFTTTMPNEDDMPVEDFDFSFHLLYTKSELQRLHKEGKISEIIRP
ncbi:MAG: hypothetical protein IPM74_00640 [Crocinitomicaceae bacterium]|nr:hypothetical protein [Crocinitomicaceae bacterium]MBK8924425.1 hypothetical protein [Crocinitomicaceae bacterium]